MATVVLNASSVMCSFSTSQNTKILRNSNQNSFNFMTNVNLEIVETKTKLRWQLRFNSIFQNLHRNSAKLCDQTDLN
uniref:Uncharacterized protein n=1 Tax=Anguilla anguilla TaxID=7936 RepID=A0A0E9QXK9_ANGAN